MILMKENVAPKGCDPFMYGGQAGIQTMLVAIAVICVPVMLLGKPLYIMRQNKTRHVPVGGTLEN